MDAATYATKGAEDMRKNPYALGGWLSIAAAVLFPITIVTAFLQKFIAEGVVGYHGPLLGPSDLLGVLFTILAVYALLVLRRFLNECYQYHGIDVLIILSIAWSVLFQVVGLASEVLLMMIWPVNEEALRVMQLILFGIFMLCVGVIDILIGVRLMQSSQGFSQLIKVFAVLSLIAGILEVAVLLSPLAMLLVPVNFVIVGLILLRDVAEAVFV
jgi:hypothetical protein